MNTQPRRRRVAVLGAGLMGAGIAYVFAAAGRRVAVYDPAAVARDEGPRRIAEMARLLGRPPAAVHGAISWHADLADALMDADLVIEAAPEDIALKKNLLRGVSATVAITTIIATNTSSIRVAALAGAITNPSRLVGAHFWNPPYLVQLVEVIQAQMTSPATVASLMAELTEIGMVPVHVRMDVPGAIGNRLQHALKREAIAVVAAGLCDAETVDTVCKAGFGARLAVTGPLEQSDMVGLDLTLNIHRQIIPDLDVTPGPHPLLEALVQRGDLGMKTGRGFRSWTPEEAERVRKRLLDHLVQAARARARIPSE